MKEEKKETKLPSAQAILAGKSASKKGDGKKDKPKPKYKRTEVLHHDDGTQTVNMDSAQAGGSPASFSRPSLEEALSAIKERHNAPDEAAPANPAQPLA